MKYSFIIPVKSINDYIKESVPRILAIKRDDYEIIIYPDETTGDAWPRTRQIATGHVGPATKRTQAIRDAKGDILIFMDDDAYPRSDFLDVLDDDFNDTKINAVGGPAVTPDNDGFWQKVSGAVFLSPLSGGYPERYVPVGNKRTIDDWPSVNFSVRRLVFSELGGFDSEFWPGEDTKLSLDLITKYPKSIIYDPKLIAFHHRRAGLLHHLKQVGGYGLHRGFFAKKYPETSRKLKYFIPSSFVLFVVIGGALSVFFKIALAFYLVGWGIYLVSLIASVFDIGRYEKNPLVVMNALYYIFFTHLWYGLMFMQGLLFTKNLKSKLR